MGWYLYVIRCNDNSLYIGITNELCRRLQEHQAQGRRCAKYLRGRGPLTLTFSLLLPSHEQALRTEALFKKKPKRIKEAVIEGRLPLLSALSQNGDLQKKGK